MDKVESEHVERRIDLGIKEHVPELEIAVDVKSSAPVHGDWTPAEERRARLKVDLIILPLLVLGFFMMQLDRGNIANALTDTILKDLGITTDDVNTRYQLLSLGVLLFEIPSNIVLQKIGPRVWITGQILAWGLVACLQMFVKGKSTFLLTGFLIGALESGFIPGSLYYISTWYKHDEYAVRNTAFYLGNLGATALSGVIASGILSMSGRSGLAGWQWLFMVEGVTTVGIGVIWLFVLPDRPTHSSPILFPRWKMLNEREIHVLATRVVIDDAQKSAGSRVHIGFRDTMHVLANWRLWQHVMITFLGMMPAQALGLYFPSIIQSLGFPKLKANALSSIGPFACVVIVMVLAWISDKTNRRGLTVIIPAAVLAIFEGTLFALPLNADKWSKFAVVCLIQSLNTVMHTLNITWLSTNCVTVKDRAIGLPMVVMAANAAGMIGPQMMRASDAPQYKNGFTAAITLTCSCTLVAIGTSTGYFWWNRKRRARGMLNEDHSAAVWVAEVEGEIEEKEVRKTFVYTW